MFKLFSNLFKKEKKVEKKEITLDSINKLIDELENKSFNEYSKESTKLTNQLKDTLSDLKETAQELKKEKIESEMDINIKRKVLSARDYTSDKLDYLFRHTEIGTVNNWNEFAALKEKAQKLLSELKDVILKKGELIKIGFKKERGWLENAAISLSNIIQKLDLIFNENADKINSINELKESSEKIKELMAQIKKSKEKLLEKEKELKDLKENQVKIKEKIKRIEATESFKRKNELKKEIKKMNDEENNINLTLQGKLNFIIKALKKYLHFYGGFIEKEKLNYIKRLIEYPIDTLKDENRLGEFLPDIKKLLEEDKIKFDEKTKLRIINNLTNIPKELSSWEEVISNLEDEKEKLIHDYENINLNEYENLIETLKVSNHWIKKLENEIPEISNRLEQKEEELEDLKYNITHLIKEHFNIDVKIE